MSAKTVPAYIDQAPEEQRTALRKIRAILRKHLPESHETLGPDGFAVYASEGHTVAGFASRADGPRLYIMVPGILDAYSGRLGPLRSEQESVCWRASDELTIAELERLADEMLAELAKWA